MVRTCFHRHSYVTNTLATHRGIASYRTHVLLSSTSCSRDHTFVARCFLLRLVFFIRLVVHQNINYQDKDSGIIMYHRHDVTKMNACTTKQPIVRPSNPLEWMEEQSKVNTSMTPLIYATHHPLRNDDHKATISFNSMHSWENCLQYLWTARNVCVRQSSPLPNPWLISLESGRRNPITTMFAAGSAIRSWHTNRRNEYSTHRSHNIRTPKPMTRSN